MTLVVILLHSATTRRVSLYLSLSSNLPTSVLNQPGPLSLVEECRGSSLIGREDHSDAPPALLCHKEPARASKAPY